MTPDDELDTSEAVISPTPVPWWRRPWVIAGVLGTGLFAVLALLCWRVADDNEQSLLERQTAQAGAVLTTSVGQLQAPLAALADTAAATNGDPATFTALATPLLTATTPYRSIQMFAAGSDQPVATVGEPTQLAASGDVDDMLARTQAAPFVAVDLLDQQRTLGLAVSDDPAAPHYVVYGERALPADANVRRRANAPFDQLQYAMYLGTTPSDQHLLSASVRTLPLEGRTASVAVPMGDSQILLVATPVDRLEGRLLADLWWIVLLGGLAATAAAVLLLRRLDHTRARAVSLAADKVRQHAEQRQIAETLQRGLLPQRLDTAPGTELASRYWPAGSANLVGGDFYDAFRVDAERWTIVIGDVCGKGIGAAALTGLVRHTIRTAIRHIDAPVDVLHAVHEAMMEHDAATFCTVCLVTYEPARTATSGFLGELTVVLGGHPQPLLVRGDEVIPVGFPGTVVGLHEPQRMEASRLTILAGDTLVLYTDGLTDAPGDGAVSVEELSELLRSTGAMSVEHIADMIGECQRSRSPRGGDDDTAVLVVRFGVDVDADDLAGDSWPADMSASLTR